MADQKISQLTEKTTLVGNDIITILDSEASNVNKKAKLSGAAGLWTYTGTAPISVTNKAISISKADTSTSGYLDSTDWNTFNGKQGALTFSSPLAESSGTVSISTADTSTTGALSSTDWNTFNGKASNQALVADAESTTATLTLAANTVYTFATALTELTISALASGTSENEIQFTTGSSFTFTAASLANKWIGIDAPSFEVNTSYVIAIKNGHAVLGKVGA